MMTRHDWSLSIRTRNGWTSSMSMNGVALQAINNFYKVPHSPTKVVRAVTGWGSFRNEH